MSRLRTSRRHAPHCRRDDHEYVSRAALLALASLQSEHVEPLAERAGKTDHEYQRIAALWALHAVGSPLLTEYIARARQDGRKHVASNAAEVAGMEAAKTV
ncbi:MAG TPA: HEAT repeat domain-containing protein [Tahibacter sp.]|nr:HEAT repeat domain-containing protein [Tahibacter sp.]